MKKLKPHKITNGILLSYPDARRQLVRYELDTYAIVMRGEEIPLFSFRSLAMSKILRELKPEISGVDILRTDHRLPEGTEHLIRLNVNHNDILIDKDDRIIGLTELTADAISQRVEVPVSNLWKIPDTMAFRSMLITPDLAVTITQMQSQIDTPTLLRRMWCDFKSYAEPRAIKPEDTCQIKGEFLRFSATEQCCGRVLFEKPNTK